jgi:hypothetical protein
VDVSVKLIPSDIFAVIPNVNRNWIVFWYKALQSIRLFLYSQSFIKLANALRIPHYIYRREKAKSVIA